MKIDLIKWDKVKPGSRIDISFLKWNNVMPSYYIKNDEDLNNFTVYNSLTGEIESYNLSIQQDLIEVDIDKTHRIGPIYPEPKVNEIVVFNDLINNPNYSFNSEKFFRIKDWDDKNKTCTLISEKSKFILRNIHYNDITSISSIFHLDNIIDKDEINSLSFNSISSTFGDYHLYIKNDKYRKFIIIIVFDIFSREYGIDLISTNDRYEIYDFKDFIESPISVCFEQILKNFYSKSMPNKGVIYHRIDLEKDELFVERKFKFKSWTCLYDLYFNNIFTDEEVCTNSSDMRKKIESVKTVMIEFNKCCHNMDMED